MSVGTLVTEGFYGQIVEVGPDVLNLPCGCRYQNIDLNGEEREGVWSYERQCAQHEQEWKGITERTTSLAAKSLAYFIKELELANGTIYFGSACKCTVVNGEMTFTHGKANTLC